MLSEVVKKIQGTLSIFLILLILTSVFLGVVQVGGWCEQEPVTLKYWNWTAADSDMPWQREFIQRFEEEYPNIKVDLLVNPAHDHHNKLLMATQVGEAPDVFQYIPEWLVVLWSADVLLPINDYISSSESNQFTQSTLDLASWQGQLYGLPWRYGCSVMYINIDMFEKAGIEIPQDPMAKEIDWNWEDLYEISKRFKEVLPAGEWGFGYSGDATNLGMSWEWLGFFFQAGGTLLDESGKAAINSTAGVEAINFYKKLYDEELIPKGVLALKDSDMLDLFGRGVVAMWQNGPWQIGRIQKAYPNTKFATVMLPKHLHDGSSAGGTVLGISKQTKHPEEAITFIKYLTSKEILSEWSERGNFMPTRKDVFTQERFQNPPMLAFVEQASKPHTINQAAIPETRHLYEILQRGIQEVLLDKKSAQDALDNVAKEWNVILEKYGVTK